VRLTVEPEAEGAGYGWTPQLGDAVAERIGLEAGALPAERLTVVRRSLDARPPRGATSRSVHWSYVVDVELDRVDAARLRVQPGRLVPAVPERARAASGATSAAAPASLHVVVVGAGPCGLFAALTLAQAGVRVTLCERGKPVEQRGKDVGALVNRRILNSESNFCYGEGGAGGRTRAHTGAHGRTCTHAHAHRRGPTHCVLTHCALTHCGRHVERRQADHAHRPQLGGGAHRAERAGALRRAREPPRRGQATPRYGQPGAPP